MTKTVQTQLDPIVYEEAEDIHIPDLWHLSSWLKDLDRQRTGTGGSLTSDQWLKDNGDAVLRCWHLAHSLRKHIINNA